MHRAATPQTPTHPTHATANQARSLASGERDGREERREPVRGAGRGQRLLRRRAARRLPQARHEMAPGQVRRRGELRRRRRGRGQGQVPEDPGSLRRSVGPNKRILYDVGAYDSDGDDDGAGEILGDILDAMSQNGPAENGLEDMQRQFEELFLRPSPSSSFCPPDAGKSAAKRRAARK